MRTQSSVMEHPAIRVVPGVADAARPLDIEAFRMIRIAPRPFAFAAILAAATAFAACGKDNSSPTTPGGSLTGNTMVVASASQSLSAVVGTAITIGFRVLNSDASAPVPNQTVTITPQAGSGTVAPTSVTSDATGHANIQWTLGTTSGT